MDGMNEEIIKSINELINDVSVIELEFSSIKTLLARLKRLCIKENEAKNMREDMTIISNGLYVNQNSKPNSDIREMVFKSGIRYRAVADEMGISPVWLSRVLAKPLTAKMYKRIISAMERLTNGKLNHAE